MISRIYLSYLFIILLRPCTLEIEVSWCGRSILLIGRNKNSMDDRLFRSRSEMLKKRDAVARQCVFGVRSVRGTRRIIERDIKTKEQEILVLIRVSLKLFLFLNTSYLFPASARAILGKVSTHFRATIFII